GLDLVAINYSNSTDNELRYTVTRSGNYAAMLYTTRPTTDPTPEYTLIISLTPLTNTQTATVGSTGNWVGNQAGGAGTAWNFDAFDPTNGTLNSAILTVHVNAVINTV